MAKKTLTEQWSTVTEIKFPEEAFTGLMTVMGPVLVKVKLIKFIQSELIAPFVQLFLLCFTNNYIFSLNNFCLMVLIPFDRLQQ